MPKLLHMLTIASKVAVLLLLTVGYGVTSAGDVSPTNLRLFQFCCEFQFPNGRGYLDGLMASDGYRQRIAIYWIEPDVFREGPSYVRHSDFIFTSEGVYYWVYPDAQHGTLLAGCNDAEPLLLPEQDSVESIVRSALAVVSHMRKGAEDEPVSLEVSRFSQGSHGLTQYACETPPADTGGNESLSSATDSDVRAFTVLLSGTRYSKDQRADGTFLWRAKNVLSGRPVATVTIKRAPDPHEDSCSGVFSIDTLGRWFLIPETYTTYWTFDRILCTLNRSPDERTDAHGLCDEIESYLCAHDLPRGLRRGMHRLWCKAALMTGDPARVCRSVQAAVGDFCEDASLSKYRALLELARFVGQIEKRCPQQSLEWLRPLVGRTVKHGTGDTEDCFDRLMPLIEANRWFVFGKLLLDEVRREGLMEEEAIELADLRLEASQLAREVQPSDPCESFPRVREYLARLDTTPPTGTIVINDVRHIVAKFLVDDGSSLRPALIEDIVRSIRVIAGEGPFRGNRIELTKSVERFSECYRAVYGASEPITTTLVTFLALEVVPSVVEG